MPPLLALIPFLLACELAQLVISERYLGKRQIAVNADPRNLGLGEWTAFFWSGAILLSWLWMTLMLLQPVGRPQVIFMIVVSIIGYAARRNCALNRLLIVLTFEGALRIGMMLSIIGLYWRER